MLPLSLISCKKNESSQDPNTLGVSVSFFGDSDLFLSKNASECDQDFLNELVFFGESTTAHLRAREVLADGKNTTQVWSDASGTRMLSSQGLSTPIIYPETQERMTVKEACAKKQPRYLVLSFGVNGIVGFMQNKERYVGNYKRLIQTVRGKGYMIP